MKTLPLASAALLAVLLAGCGPSASPAAAPPAVTASAAAKAAPSPACTLKTTFDYIERDNDPGTSVMADEIGNVDFTDCSDSLADFRQTAGQGDGECTTIALASKNPGYSVNAIPAAPLKDVIESAGPGC